MSTDSLNYKGIYDENIMSAEEVKKAASDFPELFEGLDEAKKAFDEGYIYVHDINRRKDSVGSCLFDMGTVLSGGFQIGDRHYDEPGDLKEAFELIGLVTLNASGNIYGGFTIPQIDKLLVRYAEKSFAKYNKNYVSGGMDKKEAEEKAEKDVEEDFRNGFFKLEELLNSGEGSGEKHPLFTISFGIGTHRYSVAASKAAMKVRLEGHGEGDEKKPYVYPKLVFLYDRDLHGKKGRLYELFRTAVEWSAKAGYSEYLSLSGEKGMVSEVYKEYGKALSPMGCMLFLTKWYERGGEAPVDDDDEPVFSGRFSIGTVTLNLPMIFALSKTKNTDFFAELDHYLELSRQIHKRTYELLAVQKADIDPLAFMQGGFYGGTLESGECIGPLLKSATALFGFTALNELQQLYNKNSIAEDGKFAFDVLKHINEKAEEFRKEDHIQYSVYGTPCESLCNAQCDTFKEKYGSGEDACAIEHFSNSFHCCESEEIEPVRRQNLEARFWNYSDGGKIQYTQCTTPEDTAALEAMIVHAMELGLYEGINI